MSKRNIFKTIKKGSVSATWKLLHEIPLIEIDEVKLGMKVWRSKIEDIIISAIETREIYSNFLKTREVFPVLIAMEDMHEDEVEFLFLLLLLPEVNVTEEEWYQMLSLRPPYVQFWRTIYKLLLDGKFTLDLTRIHLFQPLTFLLKDKETQKNKLKKLFFPVLILILIVAWYLIENKMISPSFNFLIQND